MPELPEVETIRRGLEKELVGQRILAVEVRTPKLFRGDPQDLKGQQIEEISRRAKMLIWKLSNKFLAVHLKMTGQLIFVPKMELGASDSVPALAQPPVASPKFQLLVGGHPDKNYSLELPHKHTHVIFSLEKGKLYYNDLRKFGWLKICNRADEVKTLVEKLGPEYDWPEFSLEYLDKKLMNRPKITIKQALLDQSIIAGLGNIYTDEVLFCARIRPERAASTLNQTELIQIHACIPEVLKIALKHGGTSMKDFRHVDGGWGSYLKFAKVYGRKKQPCLVCGHEIETKKIGSRTSCFCPNCQK